MRVRELLDRLSSEGQLSSAEGAELQERLRTSEEARNVYQRWVQLNRAVEDRPVPQAQLNRIWALGPPQTAEEVVPLDFELLDEAPELEVIEDGGLPTPPDRDGQRRTRIVRWGVGAGLAAAATIALTLMSNRPVPPAVQARGGQAPVATEASAEPTQWVKIYQQLPSGSAQRVIDKARPSRPFGFAYTRLQDSPYTYLAVVGLDASGRAHWFHPSYQADRVPVSGVPVEKGVADRELGEWIRIQPAPGPLRLCGVFSTGPINVLFWDEALETGGGWPSGEGWYLDCHELQLAEPAQP